MSTKRPVWSWTDAVAKADVQPMTKFVCLNIARYFSSAGKGWRVSIKEMMADTGLSNRSLATHLKLAEDAKLLIVKREAGPHGQRGVTTYIPCFPDGTELAREAEVPPREGGSLGPSEPSSPGPSEPASLRPSEPASRQVSFHQQESFQETPPTPSQARGTPRKVKSALPEDWSLPDDWREWARAKAPSRSLWISSEADKFKDHHIGKGTRWVDWRRAWQNWWRGACERSPPKGSMAAPVKPLPPDKTLGAPVWGKEPEVEPVRYRADTPEFNAYISRLIADGSVEEAERVQQRGWVKIRPPQALARVLNRVVERARA